jgi:hypothetical protein
MDVYDERADQADCEDVADHRKRAAAKLDQIARDAKEALAFQGIDTPLFFLVPNSGNAILTFGTTLDPDDDLWSQVADVVASVVSQLIGLAGTRCREVTCATTHDPSLA